MKPLYYLLFADALLLLIAIKIVFQSYTLFIRSIASQLEFWSEFIHIPEDDWKIKNDVAHKLNIVYAIGLALGILSFVAVRFIKF